MVDNTLQDIDTHLVSNESQEKGALKMFEPDYRNIVKAAMNQEADRLPLYEHNVSMNKIGEIVGVDMQALYNGDEKDIHEFFRIYCGFFKGLRYNRIPLPSASNNWLHPIEIFLPPSSTEKP